MAAFDATRPFANTGSAFSAVSRIASRIIGAVATWNDARLTRKSLMALTSRELDDIGLSRGDIERVANGR